MTLNPEICYKSGQDLEILGLVDLIKGTLLLFKLAILAATPKKFDRWDINTHFLTLANNFSLWRVS